VDNALRMQTLRYAVGDYLDVLGEQRNCERIQASAARRWSDHIPSYGAGQNAENGHGHDGGRGAILRPVRGH
jgi:hypothetical protein